jgi:hypothetical protein
MFPIIVCQIRAGFNPDFYIRNIDPSIKSPETDAKILA